MKVLFFGTPAFAVPTLEAIVRDHTVQCVTRPDRPVGRHATLTPSAIASSATRLGVPCWKPERLDETFLEEARSWNPDVAVLAAYGKLIKPTLLSLPRKGFLNVHPSLLPRHRGASPVASTLLAGDRETGVTIMLMDEGLDTGPILAARTIALEGTETCGALTETLSRIGATLLVETLPRWMDGTLTLTAQDETKATASSTLTRENGKLDWSKSATTIERTVRAYDPWPGTYTESGGVRIKILRTQVGTERSSDKPGTAFRADARLFVACGNGETVEVLELQPAGKQPMSASAFLAGAPAALPRFA